MKALLPHVGQGAELREILVQALSLPPNLKWFDVRFAMGEVITVRCEFMPPPIEGEPEDDDAPSAPASLDG